MCGRFALFATPAELVEYFDLPQVPAEVPEPHYNVTPGREVAVIRNDREGRRRLGLVHWGLVPFWAKDPSIGRRLINARLETLADKPAFREAFTRRRCLIPANGFYEWSAGPRRRPHFIRSVAEPLVAFAGLWERWRSRDGPSLDTCVIVTTAANATVAAIHERMPVMLARADHSTWLDPASSLSALGALAGRGPSLETWPIGEAINDPRNDDERLLAPVVADEAALLRRE